MPCLPALLLQRLAGEHPAAANGQATRPVQAGVAGDEAVDIRDNIG
ncbi:MAG: hypothetical protein ABSG53_25365 [Thermoguttaceae bacterium]|jgi:hypothetical protein